MVVITFVYVIATIAICVANLRSASATRAQLEETKRQYEEEGKAFITFMNGVAFARDGVTTFIEPAQYLFTPGQGMCEVWPEGSDKE